jgi:hypothetical protein
MGLPPQIPVREFLPRRPGRWRDSRRLRLRNGLDRPGGRAVIEDRRVASKPLIDNRSELVFDQGGDPPAHSDPRRLAIAAPRRPHRLGQWHLDELDAPLMVELCSDPRVDPGKDTALQHGKTVYRYTLATVLQGRVGLRPVVGRRVTVSRMRRRVIPGRRGVGIDSSSPMCRWRIVHDIDGDRASGTGAEAVSAVNVRRYRASG